MTTKTETKETTKKKGTPPTHEIFFTNEDGSVNYQSRIPVWTSKNGKAQNCTINGKRAVIFPVRQKQQPAAQGEGA
jgi:hypothetical protein